jgi:hypothetical protein
MPRSRTFLSYLMHRAMSNEPTPIRMEARKFYLIPPSLSA